MPRTGAGFGFSIFKHALLLSAPIVGVGLFLFGLIVLGGQARDWLRSRDHHAITFADIACDSPPGKDREEFLTEVQYLSSLPDRVQLLDSDLAARLGSAFARHPQVEKVEKVEVLTGRRVLVRLKFRPR
ncbi:MAG: hypothetical protein K2R98_02105 [Gemmataceae bacterium]|nr:hypothetical protein [Gemmataceae bacterium]